MKFFDGRRVVVCGGAGFIGSQLSELLLDAGAEVVVLDDLSRGSRIIDGVQFFKADVSKVESCKFFFRDAFAVFNLAARVAGVLYNTSHHLGMYAANVSVLSAPVIAAEEVGVPHFLQTSSVCVYGEEDQSPAIERNWLRHPPHEANAGYAEAKRDGERMVYWSNLDHAVVVRPSNAFGPHDYFDERAHVIPALIKRALEPGDIMNVFGPPDTVREFIYSKDIAAGMMHAITRGEHKAAYNIGTSGHNMVTIGELVRLIIAEVGRHYADAVHKTILFNADVGGGDSVRYSDCSLAHELGWIHDTTLAEGLRETVNWYVKTI